MFLPNKTKDILILKKDYKTHDGTFTLGHEFKIIGEGNYNSVNVEDSQGRKLYDMPLDLFKNLG